MKPILDVNELPSLAQLENLVLVDARAGKDAKSNYEAKHLQGAVYVDLDLQLAHIDEDFSKGGRHPLPPLKQFSETLSALGISEKSHVVIYDDKNASNASARLWWMLASIGHKNVQVLDGGFQAAEKVGFPMSSGMETVKKTPPYPVEKWMLSIANMAEVEKVSQDKDHLVIDVRDANRYHGETEPIDLVAGHIPGANNVPFTENLDEDGFFLSPETLKKKYEGILAGRKSNEVIVHCGSGVTACHTLLAMAHAGLEIPKLYVGSWSEWSRNNKPMVTKEN
ncbi:sulfurtransferase [Rhodonellum sp.]|uniref:sulfurtransferase n=1 Tax=Rhodonellum sp. TaxID=2231180 RepID=UPI002717D01F|nr:sulfurtransferase [Rhodonellum sp.]MDO9554737.1 sulfurtransferase [Rhodonellum sp.]